ncbi:MAG: quinolinate synthase NadA [Sulfurovum sp.]|nr:quinolinate synthase NadA [Sulfurovum sp.]
MGGLFVVVEHGAIGQNHGPNKSVYSCPKLPVCAMARMMDGSYFERVCTVHDRQRHSTRRYFALLLYINSDASVKAKVGEMGGYVRTSLPMRLRL